MIPEKFLDVMNNINEQGYGEEIFNLIYSFALNGCPYAAFEAFCKDVDEMIEMGKRNQFPYKAELLENEAVFDGWIDGFFLSIAIARGGNKCVRFNGKPYTLCANERG